MTLTGRQLRRTVIEISQAARVGHIGSALCICDILAVLFRDVLRGVGSSAPDRDRLVLSKGHAATALYAALHAAGVLSRKEIFTYCRDGSRLGVHPELGAPGVDLATGSLGLGLSMGAGMALWNPARVFVLMSDAEMNEGSTWEAAMFAAHHKLTNLTGIVDVNGMQAMGRTRDVLDLEPLAERWRAFGWEAIEVDGHDEAALAKVLGAPLSKNRPRLVVARTVAGKGVSFMEGRLEWHYYPVDDEQARRALRELEDPA